MPENLKIDKDYYTAEYKNSKGFSGDNNYSELVLTAKKDIDLQENEKNLYCSKH